VEKGVDLLLRGNLARSTAMRIFNTHRPFNSGRPFWHKLGFQTRMVCAFRRSLGAQRVDLVHVKTSSGINFFQNSLYSLTARLSGLPVVLQIHSGRFESFYLASSRPLRAWIRYTLHRANRVVVLSRSWLERVQTIAPGAELRIVPNGLAREEIARLSMARVTPAGRVLFIGAGRSDLNRDKGLEDLLEVLPDLYRAHPESRWVLAGLTDPEGTYETLRIRGVDPEGAEPRVRCLGLVDTELKEQLLKSSTILALPSYFENMPNLLLEAMAAGLGIAATEVGAIPELLMDHGGAMFRPGDQRALFRALNGLLTSPELVAAQGKRNIQTIDRGYTMEVVEAKLEDLYREVKGGPGGVPEAGRVSDACPPANPPIDHRVA
jgi:glycosyltransferase involved in cell wall biosynthesis